MASLGKLIPSFGNASLEVAPALANINFDFALYKIEAPKEFKGVGDALSTVRRELAEDGTPHITARKLGALFDRILPSTPGLFRAYGQRASEISQSSVIDSQRRESYGIFASQAGTDATSVWAAATSGRGAIAVHLLACILARIWDGPQATSIWMEILEKRQQEINTDFEEHNITDLASLAAAKQQIPREQIREWDASARAWLRTADMVKNVQQKQLSLIVDNIKLPVNTSPDTFESVINAWKNSLTQMEGLINGISQNASNGEIILALSSWHLFPDMMVVFPTVTHVHQRDPIFTRGGVLTLGLEVPESQCNGVYWSLPLTHLRHYGAPVVSVESIDSRERSRLSLNEFLQACLGSFLQGWDDTGADTRKAIPWLAHLSDILENMAATGDVDASMIVNVPGSWFNLMLSAAKFHLSCSDNDRKIVNKLVLLGRKHGKDFLGLPSSPLLGLLERGRLVDFLLSQDEKIAFLRKVAQDAVKQFDLDHSKVFIRYRHQYARCTKSVYEYATAVPWTKKRKFDQCVREGDGHSRWLYAGGRLDRTTNELYYERLEKVFFEDASRVPSDFLKWHAAPKPPQPYEDMPPPPNRDYFTAEEAQNIHEEYMARKLLIISQNESLFDRATQEIEDFEPERMGVFWDYANSDSVRTVWFKPLYGDVDSAALFIVEGYERMLNLVRNNRSVSQEFFSLFEDGRMDRQAVVHSLAEDFRIMRLINIDPYLKSLKGISTAAMLYKDMPHASIDIRVLRQKLYHASWMPSSDQLFSTKGSHREVIQGLRPFILDRGMAFACLTMFETGMYNPSPSQLNNVMAISSGDSLYVAAALMCDPSDESPPGAIKHVVGNIGRPGIAFLVPPVDPMVRKPSLSEWPLFNHELFDGTMQNSFQGTTLHLSFTSASSPINVGFSGARDTELYMVETLISVHDKGKWVADLNILKSIDHSSLERLDGCTDEAHTGLDTPRYSITCIDNWLELLDPSSNPFGLVRAHENWQARLAAVAISVALGNTTVILPPSVCWQCFEIFDLRFNYGRKQLVLIG